MARHTQSVYSTIVDAASLFDACEVIAERLGRSRVTIDYSILRVTLDLMRGDLGWREADLNAILLSIDPNSEGQQRFLNMLRYSGFEPDLVHYRDAFVSLPPGRSPSESSGKPLVSLASRITYIAGLMARHAGAQFLVVSHSFELCGPLTDLSHRVPDGRVGVAYFASLLDYRWRLAGLFDGGIGIQFFDLDPYSHDLLGVDLAEKPHVAGDFHGGLSRF